jgi:hypothetical protein
LPGAKLNIEHLDNRGKGHCKIDVTPLYMLADPIGDQNYADQNQKCECEHLNGRVSIYETADRAGRQQHYQDRDGHGGNHYGKIFRHGHGRDDRIE